MTTNANHHILQMMRSPYSVLSPQDMDMARKAAYDKLGPIGPIKHWTQGMDHVLRAISGRMELNELNEDKKKASDAEADAVLGYFGLNDDTDKKPASPAALTSPTPLSTPTAASEAPKSAAMPVSGGFLDAVKKSEGLNLKAYKDGRQYSIGYGTKARSPNEVIDQAEAERRLNEEIGQARTMVEAFAPNMDEGTKAALTSLTFNAGPKWMQSGLGKAIKSGDLEGARKIFNQYVNFEGKPLKGLVDRRARESQWIGNADPFGGRMSLGGPIQQRNVQSIPMDNLDQPPLTSPEAWPIETQFNPDQFMQPPPESPEYQGDPNQFMQPDMFSPESWNVSTQEAPQMPPVPMPNPNRQARDITAFMQPPPESPESWMTEIFPSQEMASAGDPSRITDFAQPELPGPTVSPELEQQAWGAQVTPEMGAEEVPGAEMGVQEAPPASAPNLGNPEAALPPTAVAMAPQAAPQAAQGGAYNAANDILGGQALPFGSINRKQLEAALRNPRVSPQLKMALIQDALQKGSVKEINTGLGTIYHNPRDGRTVFVPKSEIRQREIDGYKTNEIIRGTAAGGAERVPIGRAGSPVSGGGGMGAAPMSAGPLQSTAPQQSAPSQVAQSQPTGEKLSPQDQVNKAKQDILNKYNTKKTGRIGEQAPNPDWDDATTLAWSADRKAMAEERKEEIKASYAMVKDPLEKAQKDGTLARESMDLAKKWRALASHPANDNVYAGAGAKLGYDALRTYNEAAKIANNFLGETKFKPLMKEELTIATMRNALAVQMAATLARRSDPNPTVKQFEAFMQTVPGSAIDTMTGNAMADFMEAVAIRDRAVASIAANLRNKTDFIDAVTDFDSEHGLELDGIMARIASPEERMRPTVHETGDTLKALRRKYKPGVGWTD